MSRRKAFLAGFSAFALLALTGCWDRVEIDKRGFVVGVAIDKAKGGQNKDRSRSPGSLISGTFQFIVPAGLKSSSGSSGRDSNAGRSYFNIGVEESSVAALTAKTAARTSRSPYYEHLKLILISEDIARDDSKFSDALDFFLRGKEMRRDMHVLIAAGKAREILNVRPYNENYPVAYLESTIANTMKTNYMLKSSRLGDIHEHLLRDQSFTIQLVRKRGDGIALTGAALFDGTEHRLIGELNGETTQGLNFLTGQIKGGVIETAYKNTAITAELERAVRKIKLTGGDGRRMKFTIAVEAEGTMVKSVKNLDLNDPAVFRGIERQFEDEIRRVAGKTLQTLQHKYKKDVIGLNRFLYQNHYRAWKRVAPDWERGANLFAAADIEVTVRMNIRRIGDINESERG
ncbi:Ger(x)C family spore germination protein [Paenibacillus sp. MWE-103]|uniref:Ger(X)C family spore germination protein n=1 Tax=Paenibacillus artemisiicola TaxID=1172618 RepID=A0ABS3WH68_9BACL|nr:Ger(x)C family spore germination protein [Paenibacillus artemisiicola]MBO7747630.1 Ger(x)C family spore germination protein [Paenibacillus artemisiicola]